LAGGTLCFYARNVPLVCEQRYFGGTLSIMREER
jgi:hypothetical protein